MDRRECQRASLAHVRRTRPHTHAPLSGHVGEVIKRDMCLEYAIVRVETSASSLERLTASEINLLGAKIFNNCHVCVCACMHKCDGRI